jgi:hypothetical protein
MEKKVCRVNSDNPDLMQLAAAAKVKITDIHRENGKKGLAYYCRVNGEKMTCCEARAKLLAENIFYSV